MYALWIYANEPFRYTIVSSLRLDINGLLHCSRKSIFTSLVSIGCEIWWGLISWLSARPEEEARSCTLPLIRTPPRQVELIERSQIVRLSNKKQVENTFNSCCSSFLHLPFPCHSYDNELLRHSNHTGFLPRIKERASIL
jgi:hypothetical protein